MELRRGELLFSPGSRADSVYVVLEGRLRVFAVSEGGKEVVFWHSHQGDLLGVAEFFGSDKRRSFVQARETTRVLLLVGDQLRQDIRINPDVAALLLGHLAERLCRARSSILAIATASVESRLAHLLVVLAEDASPTGRGRRVLVGDYSQQELADMVGASRQSVSEALASLRRQGQLSFDGKYVAVSADLC